MHRIASLEARSRGRQLTVAIGLLAELLATPMAARAGSPVTHPPSTDDARVSVRDGIATTVSDQVMTIGDAFGHWNGQGELLLLPSDVVGTSASSSVFTIGAVFARDDPGSGDCHPAVGAIRLTRTGAQVEFYPDAWNADEHLKLGVLDTSDAGRHTHALTSGRCRFTIRATTKILNEGRWQEVQQPSKPTLSEETVFPDPRIIANLNKLSETLAARPGSRFGQSQPWPQATIPHIFFGELTETAVGVNLTGSYTREEAERCPEVSGTVLLTPEGVHIKAPWPRENALTPGIVRNTGQRATTLILQNSQCRTELQVTRETSADGTWSRVPLASIPLALEQPAFQDP